MSINHRKKTPGETKFNHMSIYLQHFTVDFVYKKMTRGEKKNNKKKHGKRYSRGFTLYSQSPVLKVL